ncbi:NepR family anti-sigma factor [Methylobacterium oryzae CBMB20]
MSADTRRQIGQNLRTLYADTLSAPVDPRLEALIAELAKPKR